MSPKLLVFENAHFQCSLFKISIPIVTPLPNRIFDKNSHHSIEQLIERQKQEEIKKALEYQNELKKKQEMEVRHSLF
jgi:hypothetical protein